MKLKGITQLAQETTLIDVEMEGRGDKCNFLITSDIHFDSNHCNRDLLKQNLQDAREARALWIDNGDMFDLMQGRGDKRSRLDDLRPEYKGDKMFRLIQEDAVKFFRPWADMLVAAGTGNHEDSWLARHHDDPTSVFVNNMQREHDSPVAHVGMSSWVFVRLLRCGHNERTVKIYRHHGTGGGSVTKGIPAHERMGGWTPDADIIINGHNHAEYILPVARTRVNFWTGEQFYDEQWLVRIPGYKNAWENGRKGWEVKSAMRPQTQGGAMVSVYMRGEKVIVHCERTRG